MPEAHELLAHVARGLGEAEDALYAHLLTVRAGKPIPTLAADGGLYDIYEAVELHLRQLVDAMELLA